MPPERKISLLLGPISPAADGALYQAKRDGRNLVRVAETAAL